ncbi:unnamed protein product [Vicia faba]|uniref:Uncharacterized protein n=1 Tax=Vicia faba TaxID=3906 RepID=A0AAV1AH23_VICFA|nr:unnamed protein product [Vicia faba]
MNFYNSKGGVTNKSKGVLMKKVILEEDIRGLKGKIDGHAGIPPNFEQPIVVHKKKLEDNSGDGIIHPIKIFSHDSEASGRIIRNYHDSLMSYGEESQQINLRNPDSDKDVEDIMSDMLTESQVHKENDDHDHEDVEDAIVIFDGGVFNYHDHAFEDVKALGEGVNESSCTTIDLLCTMDKLTKFHDKSTHEKDHVVKVNENFDDVVNNEVLVGYKHVSEYANEDVDPCKNLLKRKFVKWIPVERMTPRQSWKNKESD